MSFYKDRIEISEAYRRVMEQEEQQQQTDLEREMDTNAQNAPGVTNGTADATAPQPYERDKYYYRDPNEVWDTVKKLNDEVAGYEKKVLKGIGSGIKKAVDAIPNERPRMGAVTIGRNVANAARRFNDMLKSNRNIGSGARHFNDWTKRHDGFVSSPSDAGRLFQGKDDGDSALRAAAVGAGALGMKRGLDGRTADEISSDLFQRELETNARNAPGVKL